MKKKIIISPAWSLPVRSRGVEEPSEERPGLAQRSAGYPAAPLGQLHRGSPRLPGTCGNGHFFGRPQVKAARLPSALGADGGRARGGGGSHGVRAAPGAHDAGGGDLEEGWFASTRKHQQSEGGGSEAAAAIARSEAARRAGLTLPLPQPGPPCRPRSPAPRSESPAAAAGVPARRGGPDGGEPGAAPPPTGCRNGAGVAAGDGRHDRRGGRAGV